MKNFILVLGVFFAVCVFWSYAYSNKEFLDYWNCISESGDNDMCNGFQDCIKLVPQCYLLPYFYCMKKILPKGAGNCSNTEQAYGSEKQRSEIEKCYSEITTLPNGEDWTNFQEFEPFLSCVEDLGKKCKSRKNRKSSESGESNSHEHSKSSESGSHDRSKRSESGSHDRSESGESNSHEHSKSSESGIHDRSKRSESGSHDRSKSSESGSHEHSK